MLKIENLVVNYGAICAVQGISLEVPKSKIVTLIGANGAGKSTTVRTISKLIRPKQGKIILEGEDVTALPAKEMVKRGVVQSPEGRHVFPTMTVEENLRLGAYQRKDSNVGQSMETVHKLFPKLKDRSRQMAGTLSGGEQQMLAIGRALMANPRLLILDEPSLGLAPILVSEIFRTIQTLNSEQGLTVLLIEQNAKMALKIADYAYVLEIGKIALEGTGSDLLNDARVQELYLGKNA